MGKNISAFFKKIFLSSVAGIAASNPTSVEAKGVEANHLEKLHGLTEETLTRHKNLEKKFLLKLNSNLEWEYSTHRSHRSHSSHRSHYSSSTGSGSSSSSSGSRSSSSGAGSSSGIGGNTGGTYYYSNPTPTKVVRLGDRVLKRGMQGRDVTELVNLLLRKDYIAMSDGSTSVTGIQTYDRVVEEAVMQFQLDKNLDADGVAGPATIYYLKNY